MWIARRQAEYSQRGALAGAVARGYDDFDAYPSLGGLADESAHHTAEANLIWQQSGSAVVTFDCPSGVTGRCVRVEVFRDGTNSSTPCPRFGPILGSRARRSGRRRQPSLAANAMIACDGAFADDWQTSNTAFNYDEAPDLLGRQPGSYTAPSAAQSGNTMRPAFRRPRRTHLGLGPADDGDHYAYHS
jgi:hypothetical protein